MTRNIGMHAGGVLIAPGKLTDFSPLYQQPGSDSAVSQYDKDDVEAVGLVKFDFLGLATLTILEIAKDFIVARHKGQENFAFENIPLDDAAHLQAVRRRQDRGGVPVRKPRHAGHAARRQADAAGRPDRAQRAVPPGPDGPDPELRRAQARPRAGRVSASAGEPRCSSETYGIMVYQEQVMQTAQILGGYSLGGADLLRRAMGKKKAEEMAEHRQIFREGAAKNGIDEEKADEIFDLMEKFAGYGFNKSHAAAYSLLAYHTGWLKVHYTAEFFCANMTVEMDDTDKLKVLFEDAQKNFGITFEPPDVNRGVYRFEPVSRQGDPLRPGRRQGHGAGRDRGDRAARGEGGAGRSRSLYDFCVRVDRTRINKRTVEALDQGRRLRLAAAQSRVAGRDRSTAPSISPTRTAANANQGGLFDMGDMRMHGQHAGARAGRRHALGREGAPDLREDGDRLLSVGAPVRRESRSRCGVLQAARSTT